MEILMGLLQLGFAAGLVVGLLTGLAIGGLIVYYSRRKIRKSITLTRKKVEAKAAKLEAKALKKVKQVGNKIAEVVIPAKKARKMNRTKKKKNK